MSQIYFELASILKIDIQILKIDIQIFEVLLYLIAKPVRQKLKSAGVVRSCVNIYGDYQLLV